MLKFIIETQYPIAYDSKDHLEPVGTKNDNHSSIAFIQDIESTFGNRMNFMDLGCAGGLLVHDCARRGHLALGLEGSDYSIKHQRAEWPALYQRNLFTCDISREYSVYLEQDGDKKPFLCDVITAWEVTEHIPPDRLNQFFENIRKHLRIGGQFMGSVSTSPDPMHASIYTKTYWEETILNRLDGLMLKKYPYPPINTVRAHDLNYDSFMILLERKN